MNCKFQATTLLALALICAYFPAESASNPLRCLCINSINQVRFRIVEDYLIIPKEAHCRTTQIILVINYQNSKMEVCLNPETKQGRALVACWDRIGHDITRKKECILTPRKRAAEN
ncbi:chemokine (C-X-C motif) ligand 18a, duplicate 1 [Heptranchias perlo]|uniref:chemokine (C-X-C motif) ligand 18a, duplicate 1 n=1 Tax=Heptranchias perlo TaxID=212740 RepID=UPI00355A4158